MSINKHFNHNSNCRSFLQRVMDYIKENLAFRNQLIQLQRRGKTPNFLYLTSGTKGRKHCDNGHFNESCIKPLEAKGRSESDPPVILDEPFESLSITLEEDNVGELTTLVSHHAIAVTEHDPEDNIIDLCPEVRDQIEKPLPIPNQVLETTLTPSDSSYGKVEEVVAITCSSEDESERHKAQKESAPSPKRSHKMRGEQVHGRDLSDQMQLPFE